MIQRFFVYVVLFSVVMFMTLPIEAREGLFRKGLYFAGKGLVEKTIQHQTLERTYYIKPLPRKWQGQKRPALVFLHGGGGHAKQISNFLSSAYKDRAEADGVLLVYPDGYNKSWNDGRNDPHISAQKAGIDDIGFISKMLDELVVNENVDPERIYIAGISNGAMMTNRVGCELSEKVAGLGIFIGSMPANIAPDCHPEKPLTVFIMNGTADPLVPYSGGQVQLGRQKRGAILSTSDTAKFWADNAAYKHKPSELEQWLVDRYEDDTSVKKVTYSDTSVPVVLYEIHGGGHNIPGRRQYFPERIIGKTSQEIDGASMLWWYFFLE